MLTYNKFMQKSSLVLDTGVILPFCFIQFPTSKERVIDFMVKNFEIFVPKKVDEEMQKPKESLKDKWDEISYTWQFVRSKVNRLDPPDDCVNIIFKQYNVNDKFQKKLSETDVKILALGLYLSRSQRSSVFLLTRERTAFMWFNFISRRQQLGHVLSPFDFLTFTYVYLGLPYSEIDYVWGELCQFPGTTLELPLKPMVYRYIDVCMQHCNTKICQKSRLT